MAEDGQGISEFRVHPRLRLSRIVITKIYPNIDPQPPRPLHRQKYREEIFMSFTATSRLCALAAGSLLSFSLLLMASRSALADPLPHGAQAENVKQIGFSALGGRFGGFKIAIKHTANDKWYLYTGHSFNQGWSIVDVTDPANPRYVKFIPYVTDDKSIITAQVTLHDNLMLTSLNSFKPQKNPLPAVLLWDISDPENPKQVGSWMGGVTGAHRNSYPGGKYAYLSTSYPGFKSHIMVILDVSDPAHPKDVGKWWQPGQKDGEPPSPYPEGFHGPVNVSPDGKMASLALHARRGQSRHHRSDQSEADRQACISPSRSPASASNRCTPCCRCGTASCSMSARRRRSENCAGQRHELRRHDRQFEPGAPAADLDLPDAGAADGRAL